MAAVPSFHYSYDTAGSLFQADAGITSNVLALAFANSPVCVCATYRCACLHKHTFSPVAPSQNRSPFSTLWAVKLCPAGRLPVLAWVMLHWHTHTQLFQKTELPWEPNFTSQLKIWLLICNRISLAGFHKWERTATAAFFNCFHQA